MPWVASEPIRIVVPGPPKAQGRQRHRIVEKRDGSRFVANYMPTQTAQTQSTIRAFAAVVMGNRPPIDGTVELRMVAYMPIPASWSKKKQAAAIADQIRPTGRPDFDNISKAVADSVVGICLRDDAILTDVAIWKRYGVSPRLVLELRSLTWQD